MSFAYNKFHPDEALDTDIVTSVGDVRYLKLLAISDTKHYTGFPNRTDSTLAFVPTVTDPGDTRELTISGTDFKIWVDGVEYTLTSLTKQIPDVTGLYWFWITIVAGVPTLQGDTSGQTFGDCLVATVYYNATTKLGIVSDERHWMGRDKWWHEYTHETIGARYAYGMAGTFTNTTVTIGSGEFYDEDIEHEWLSDITTVKVLYHNGDSDWAWDVLTTPYKVTNPGVNNTLNYNSGTTLSAAGNQKFVNYWVYATGDVSHPIHVIIGTAEYNTLALARGALPPSLGSLASAEAKLIYKVTYQNSAGTPSYQEASDYRTSGLMPSTNYVPTNHSTLANLGFSTSGHTGFASSNHAIQMNADLHGAYAQSQYVKLLDMGRASVAFPNGITITSWYVDCVTSTNPTTELNANLRYCDGITGGAMPGGNIVLVDVLDSTDGNSSETNMANSNLGSGLIPAGKILYVQMDADPTDTATIWALVVNFSAVQ